MSTTNNEEGGNPILDGNDGVPAPESELSQSNTNQEERGGTENGDGDDKDVFLATSTEEEDDEDDDDGPFHDDDDDDDDDDGKRMNDDNDNRRNPYDIQNLNVIPADLRYWNVVAALLHGGQAAVLIYFALDTTSTTTKWSLYTHFPQTAWDDDVSAIPVSKWITSYSVMWYSAGFLGVSAVHHALVAFLLEPIYHYYLQRHQNPLRWLEYSITMSAMRLLVAHVCGITDIHVLFSIVVLSGTAILLGYAGHESVNAQARADGDRFQNWFTFTTATWIPQLASWAIVLCYFFHNIAQDGASSPPLYLWFLLFGLLVHDVVLIPLLFWLQWSDMAPLYFDNYLVGEKGFLLLSLVAKAGLAWIQYLGEGDR